MKRNPHAEQNLFGELYQAMSHHYRMTAPTDVEWTEVERQIFSSTIQMVEAFATLGDEQEYAKARLATAICSVLISDDKQIFTSGVGEIHVRDVSQKAPSNVPDLDEFHTTEVDHKPTQPQS